MCQSRCNRLISQDAAQLAQTQCGAFRAMIMHVQLERKLDFVLLQHQDMTKLGRRTMSSSIGEFGCMPWLAGCCRRLPCSVAVCRCMSAS